ncbi:MAG: hypothetical protein ACSHYF_08555 [Verrucomicrobiaceae bacterium]
MRLPKGFDLPVGRIRIENRGNSIVLLPETSGWPENFDELFGGDPNQDWELPARPKDDRNIAW